LGKPPVHPVVWSPPTAPARARQRASVPPMPRPELIPLGANGPEDVAVAADGSVYTGVEDGRILRLPAGGGPPVLVADTGSRPLGVEVGPDGDLIVCDAYRGLLRVAPDTGRVDVLVDEVGGEPMLLCDNAAVAPDGAVYFSDSSRHFTLAHWRADLIEHSGTGRLLRRDPDGNVDVLLDGLQFANGVALAADGSFVAVAETGAYRVTRLWLTGPRAGHHDVLVDNLPGFPDNLATGDQGRIWIALAAPRNPLLDWAHHRHPALRRGIWALPERWQPAPVPTAWVLAIDADGNVVHDLQGSHGHRLVTGVREHRGTLYLGSLVESNIARLALN
jgi:sugar lactone lactonase YvrE